MLQTYSRPALRHFRGSHASFRTWAPHRDLEKADFLFRHTVRSPSHHRLPHRRHSAADLSRPKGEILVESPEIPTDLVEPTVTAAATERIQVIQQRLMARDSLLPIVEKFNLFPFRTAMDVRNPAARPDAAASQIALVDIERRWRAASRCRTKMPRTPPSPSR